MKLPDQFAAMGMVALLPGMRHMLERMKSEVERIEQTVAAYQEREQELTAPKRRGRPPGSKDRTGLLANHPRDPLHPHHAEWAEKIRKAKAVSRQNKLRAAAGATHPRDPRHPDHEAWKVKMRKAQQKRWKNMSAADRKKQIGKMIAGQQAVRGEIKQVNGAA